MPRSELNLLVLDTHRGNRYPENEESGMTVKHKTVQSWR